MNESLDSNRRTVLKTIGAGVVGGTVLTGSATASTGRTDVYLRGHNFTPSQANVSLGGEGGSATVRWTNDEVDYFGEGFPVPHDVHIHHGDDHLVESGVFVQPIDLPIDLGPSYYEVEFRDVDGDLEIEEVGGQVDATLLEEPPFIVPGEETQTTTIEDWGGKATLDVHCSLHSIALEVDENELVGKRDLEEEDAPHGYHLGFFKMEGGLTITR